MRDKIPIRARSVIAFLMLGLMLALSGCFSRGPKGDDAQKLKRQALAQYVSNTNAIHAAQQKAYQAEVAANAQNLFNQGLARIKEKADADGKVSSADVVLWITQITSERDNYIAEGNKRVDEIRVTIAEADKDIYTALKLDDLLERFNESGVDAQFAQSAVDSILEIVKGTTKPKK